MHVLKEINTFPAGFLISGVLIFNVMEEGQFHDYKAPRTSCAPRSIFFS